MRWMTRRAICVRPRDAGHKAVLGHLMYTAAAVARQEGLEAGAYTRLPFSST